MKPGFIVLNKPVGVRSTFCVDRVRSALGRSVRVGHGGTLDSTASGVLVLLIGSATRLSDLVMSTSKIYRAKIALGRETSTCDSTGDIVSEADASHIADQMIDSVLPSLVGWREQVPPKISAVHVNGRRAHHFARSGEDVVLAPRPIFVKKIDRLSGISPERCFDVRVECGRGTYIRSIARDIGRMLGVGAHIASLVRERSGAFDISEAADVSDDVSFDRETLREMIVHPEILARSFTSYACSDEQEALVRNGRAVGLASLERISFGAGGTVIVIGREVLSVGSVDVSSAAAMFVPSANISLGDNDR